MWQLGIFFSILIWSQIGLSTRPTKHHDSSLEASGCLNCASAPRNVQLANLESLQDIPFIHFPVKMEDCTPGQNCNCRYSAGFGLRGVHPVTGARNIAHVGIDMAGPIGVSIHNAMEGEVIRVGKVSGYGKRIEISHGDYTIQNERGETIAIIRDMITTYNHLSTIAPNLKPGDKVRAGDIIGAMGKTGRVTGSHLHFELGGSKTSGSIECVPANSGDRVYCDPEILFARQLGHVSEQTNRACNERYQ